MDTNQRIKVQKKCQEAIALNSGWWFLCVGGVLGGVQGLWGPRMFSFLTWMVDTPDLAL